METSFRSDLRYGWIRFSILIHLQRANIEFRSIVGKHRWSFRCYEFIVFGGNTDSKKRAINDGSLKIDDYVDVVQFSRRYN